VIERSAPPIAALTDSCGLARGRCRALTAHPPPTIRASTATMVGRKAVLLITYNRCESVHAPARPPSRSRRRGRRIRSPSPREISRVPGVLDRGGVHRGG